MRTFTLRWQLTEWAKWFALVALLVFAGACQPVPLAPATSQAFLATWGAQLDKYREEFVAKDTAIRNKAEANLQTQLALSADPWKTLVSSVFESSVMVREAFTIAGRGEALKAFIKHMQTHPSPGLSAVWFLRQAEDVQSEARGVDAKTKAFFSAFDQKVGKDAKWILEIEQLAREQGMVAGKIEELQSLHKQAASYYQDMQQAEVVDRYQAEKQAQATQALLAYLNQLNHQQQLLNSLNRPRTCTFFANTMNCH